MATGTFSARYMRIFYRDWAFKAVLAVLIGTFTFSYTLMRHVEEDDVPNLGVTMAGSFLGLGILLFVIFLDRAIHRLRPVAVAALVAKAGRKALREVLEEAARPDAPAVVPAPFSPPGEPARVVRMVRGGAIQAIDFRGLGKWAHANDSLVVLRHPVGDFVSAGAALIDVYGADPGAEAEDKLRSMVALGVERTIEQDPAFAVRIMVDIAIRALSPAVNDPTTAVQVLDHLEDLLRLVGQTDLSDTGAPLEDMDSGLVDPDPALDGLPHVERHRDPRVRRDVDPGRPPTACDARGAVGVGPARAARGRPSRARTTRSDRGVEMGRDGRRRPRVAPGPAGRRRPVGDDRRRADACSTSSRRSSRAKRRARSSSSSSRRRSARCCRAGTSASCCRRSSSRSCSGSSSARRFSGSPRSTSYVAFLSDFGLALLFFFAGLEVIEHHVPRDALRRGTVGWGMSLAIGVVFGVLLDQLGVDAVWWLLSVALATTALGHARPDPLGREAASDPARRARCSAPVWPASSGRSSSSRCS